MVKISASGIKYIALLIAIFLSVPGYAEILKVTGRVQDVEGEPLIGVSVVQKDDPKNAVVTDVNGTYNISIKRGATLTASYIGFETEEKKVNGTTLDFILKENVSALDELVVTGYSTQKKISVLGAQSTLKMEHVKAPVANMTNVLAGRVAGVVAVQRTGLPGQDDADIWIRGLSTLTNRNEGPLVLVDGIERSFSQLDPEDIESITVLKDAASTAVYGVRGGNGVIIITTKPGVVGTPKFSFDIYQGITQLTKIPSLVDGVEYMEAVNEAYMNSKGSVYYKPNYITNTKIANGYPLTPAEQEYANSVAGDPTINKYLYPSVDWMNEMYHKYGYNGRYNVNIRGGAPNATYYVSLSYYNEKGMTKKDPAQDYSSEITYDRYNFLTNINLKATKTTKVDIGVSGWITGGNYPEQSIGTIFGKAMQTNPVIYPVQYPNGENPGISPDNRELDSPWVTLTRRGYQTQNRTQVNTNLKLTQDLGFWNWSKGLEARALISFDVKANQEIHYKVDDSTWGITATQDPVTGTWVNDEFLYGEDGNILLAEKYKGNKSMSVESKKWVYRTFYLEAALTYNRQFAQKHNVSAMALFTMRNYLDANDSNLFDTLPHKQQSVALRASYDFNSRYFVEFNGGYTGSENFLKGHRFGFFPAVAAGWVPSNEPWWGSLSNVISFFKVRYSYGIVGNDSSNGRFTYFAKLASVDPIGFSNYWTRNGANGQWHYSSYGYEPMWSRVHKQDLGIELNLFNTDLSIVVDLFKEKRDHIFVERTDLPFLAGLEANPYANVGVVKNKGIEISAEYTHRFGDDWLISLRGNMTYNKDEVVENAQADPAYPWLDRRGHNVLAAWGYIAEGLYTSEEQIKERNITQFGETYPGQLVKPGDIMYKDLNGDGHIDDYDQTCISRGDLPALYYGFGGDFRFKNVGVGVLFQGTAKADRLLSGNGIRPFQSSSGGGTLYSNISDRWDSENPEYTDVFYPRLAWGSTDPSNENNFKTSTWWKKDMSFLRLKQFTISFYFPKAWQKTIFKGGRFYFMGENVLTWSKFKLWDPELNTSNGISYPNVRTFSIGVNFNL